jgi:hypothetical protein
MRMSARCIDNTSLMYGFLHINNPANNPAYNADRAPVNVGAR